MKIWLKYLLGIILGVILALNLPLTGARERDILDFIADLVLHFGRYALIPVVFFSTAISFYELRSERTLFKTALWTGAVILASTALLALIGSAAAALVRLPRIPITERTGGDVPALDVRQLLESMVPASSFDTLREGSFLLPCFVFGGLAGAACASDRGAAKTAISLFDSLSNVFYTVLGFIVEVFAACMAVLMYKLAPEARTAFQTAPFVSLFIMLSAELLIVGAVIYPLLTRLITGEKRPYRVLYASLCPLFTALVSGDTNLTLTTEIRHTKESLGVRRRANSFCLPLFSVFARGGAALVLSTSFILILRSYSALEIGFSTLLWIFGVSIGLSFILGGIPAGGPFIALASMCSLYGRGFETGYLLLEEAAPILCAFAAAFDVLTAMFGTHAVASKTRMVRRQELRKFI